MVVKVANPQRLILREYGDSVVCRIEGDSLRALKDANVRWKRALNLGHDPIRIDALGEGQVSLRAEGVTGAVRAGAIDIEIAPKFLSTIEGSWQTVLWRVLSAVQGGYVDDNLTTAAESDLASMPDLLAEMFLDSFSKGAARGLPRNYQSEQASGTMLRGSLDVSRLGDWVSSPWIVPYRADILTDDTSLSRLLRWTAATLARTVRAPGRARALRQVEAGLAHVGRQVPHPLDAQRIELGLQHRGLEPARLVGVLLLEGAGAHHSIGDYELSGFLWKSDLIYENYVYLLCGRASALRGGRVSKQPLRFGLLMSGHGRLLETVPDVVFRDGNGRPIAVADSKYKVLGTRPKSSDTYQVLTAGHVLGCERVALTYPVSTDQSPTVWRVPSELGGRAIELTALPLNLMSLTRQNGQRMLVRGIADWLNRPRSS